MGLKKFYLDYILESITMSIGDLTGKKMLELGDQEVKGDSIPERTGKEYFENRGIFHTSVDLNGLHGAIKIDLSKPAKTPEWVSYFDIITNAGTSEHVEPKQGQFECFRNVHTWLKVGGIAIHVVPNVIDLEGEGLWNDHCNNYYSQSFFELLAKNNDYEIISLKTAGGLIYCCLLKKSDIPFMKDRRSFLRYIQRRRGGIVYRGVNDSQIRRAVYQFARRMYHVLGIKRLIIRLGNKGR